MTWCLWQRRAHLSDKVIFVNKIKEKAMNTTSFITGTRRTQGLIAPAAIGEHVLVKLKGPGVFVCAAVTRQNDPAGLTFVSLDLDGQNVVSLSFEAAANWGFTAPNNYGISLLQKNPISALTIGYPLPLRFEKELILKVNVQEMGVTQILANVIHGT
jgi:hypothetical protein